MTRRLGPLATSALALVLTSAALAGCSSDDDPDRPDPSPTASTDPTASPTASTLTPVETEPAVVVPQDGAGAVACAEGAGAFLIYDRIVVRRPVTLAVASFTGATDVTQGTASVAPAPKGAVHNSGMSKGTSPMRSVRAKVGWAERVPLSGARLKRGQHYFFVAFTAARGTHFDGVELSWTEKDGTVDRATYPADTTFEKAC